MSPKLFPAIDLRGGHCVRLVKGDYDQETIYGDDPVAQALAFEAAGADWLHVVDLDAALTGDPVNRPGVQAIMGTAAVENPQLVAKVAAVGSVAVGLDLRGTEIAVHGWTKGSGLQLDQALERYAALGAEAFVVTQIDRDGTLAGPDLEGLTDALSQTSVDVVASGGVGQMKDLEQLADLQAQGRHLAGIIIGKALYEGTVDLASAAQMLAER